jgi:hypothetical protein
LFHSLRKHRRQFGAVAMTAFVAWLFVALVDCMHPAAPLHHTVAIATAGAASHLEMADGAGLCAAETCALLQSIERHEGDDQPAPAMAQEKLLATVISVAIALLPAPSAREAPPAPDPLLPGRTPALRFYGLRI